MSRVGRMPIQVPEGVTAKIDGTRVEIKGPKGELKREFREEMKINLEDGVITVQRPSDEPRMRALHGLTRSLINNMVIGVNDGFEKTLQIEGVGYRPELEGETLVLQLIYPEKDYKVEFFTDGSSLAQPSYVKIEKNSTEFGPRTVIKIKITFV